MIAFTVYDYKNDVVIDDPAYVYWKVALNTYKNLNIVDRVDLGVRKCTEGDWAQFYEFNDFDQKTVNFYKEIDAFYCIERDEPILIRGENDLDSSQIEINLYGCNSLEENHNCSHTSLQDLRDYLGKPDIIMAYNFQSFDSRYYKKHKMLKRQAKLHTEHVPKNQPNFMRMEV